MKKLSLGFIAFLQALGIITYCSLVGLFFSKAESLLGPKPGPLGPVIFLSFFATSATICSLIFFSYPVILYFDKKNIRSSIKLIIYSALWLLFFVVSGITLMAIF